MDTEVGYSAAKAGSWTREGLYGMWGSCMHPPVHLADDVVGVDGLPLG